MQLFIKKFSFFVFVFSTCGSSLTFEENFIARVFFSEAGAQCSPEERLLVASTALNRINHKGFGNLGTLYEVVKQPNAFSCINDNRNGNWSLSSDPSKLNGRNAYPWWQSTLLASGNFTPYDKRVVYYHDNSITCPKSWNNRYWNVYVLVKTKNFTFYGVIEK